MIPASASPRMLLIREVTERGSGSGERDESATTLREKAEARERERIDGIG